MTLINRYTLVIAGVIIFLVATPVMIYGIRGYVYDFDNNRLIKTGILVVKTEPKEVRITAADGGINRVYDKAGTIRFLRPDDYSLTVQKDGFHTWSKRLSVRGGLVTWANEGTDKIYLLPLEPKLKKETADYVPEEQSPNYVYILEKSQTTPGTADLIRVNSNATSDKSVILTGLIYRENSSVVSSANGLVFVIIDRVLYQAGTALEYVAEGVDFAQWDENINKLIYGNAHEINFFDPFDAGNGQTELLIRTSETGGGFCIMPTLGYALRAYGNEIRAVELDSRDKRNIYKILNFNSTPEIIRCDKEGEEIIVKNEGTYKTYSLR